MRVHKFQRAHLKFHPKIETVHGKLCNWWHLFLCAIYDIVELWRHKSQWDCPGSSVQDISATITQRAASQTCGAKWFNIGEILCQDLPSFCKLSWIYRADFRFASSQWETSLQSNAAFHWLGASIESSLIYPILFLCRHITASVFHLSCRHQSVCRYTIPIMMYSITLQGYNI